MSTLQDLDLYVVYTLRNKKRVKISFKHIVFGVDVSQTIGIVK